MPMLTQSEIDELPKGTIIYLTMGEEKPYALTLTTKATAKFEYFLSKDEAEKHIELNKIINKLKE